MGFWNTVLQPYRARAELERKGMLMAEDWFRGKRADRAQGLLGSQVTTEGELRSAERFSPQGQPIYDRATLQPPRTEYTGFLGSPQGPGQVAQLKQRAIDMGYSVPETSAITSGFTAGKPTTLQQQFEYYQSLPESQQGQLLDYKRAGAQNINLNPGQPGRVLTTEEKVDNNLNPEATFQYDKNGMIKSVSKERFSQPQILSGGFATRMNTASQDIDGILGDEEFNPGGIVQNIEEFGLPSMIANFMRSPDGQKYRQAQENWITANLRKESGAAIPTTEIESERRKWFPMPGDSKAVITQKRKSRQDAERAMRKASGGAFEDLEDQADREELEELRQLQGDL